MRSARTSAVSSPPCFASLFVGVTSLQRAYTNARAGSRPAPWSSASRGLAQFELGADVAIRHEMRLTLHKAVVHQAHHAVGHMAGRRVGWLRSCLLLIHDKAAAGWQHLSGHKTTGVRQRRVSVRTNVFERMDFVAESKSLSFCPLMSAPTGKSASSASCAAASIQWSACDSAVVAVLVMATAILIY